MTPEIEINPEELTFSWLSSRIVGIDSFFHTPFGERMLAYCDYTAS